MSYIYKFRLYFVIKISKYHISYLSLLYYLIDCILYHSGLLFLTEMVNFIRASQKMYSTAIVNIFLGYDYQEETKFTCSICDEQFILLLLHIINCYCCLFNYIFHIFPVGEKFHMLYTCFVILLIGY